MLKLQQLHDDLRNEPFPSLIWPLRLSDRCQEQKEKQSDSNLATQASTLESLLTAGTNLFLTCSHN